MADDGRGRFCGPYRASGFAVANANANHLATCESADVAADLAGMLNERGEMLAALRNLIEAHRRVVHGEATHVPAALLTAGESALSNAGAAQ